MKTYRFFIRRCKLLLKFSQTATVSYNIILDVPFEVVYPSYTTLKQSMQDDFLFKVMIT